MEHHKFIAQIRKFKPQLSLKLSKNYEKSSVLPTSNIKPQNINKKGKITKPNRTCTTISKRQGKTNQKSKQTTKRKKKGENPNEPGRGRDWTTWEWEKIQHAWSTAGNRPWNYQPSGVYGNLCFMPTKRTETDLRPLYYKLKFKFRAFNIRSRSSFMTDWYKD